MKRRDPSSAVGTLPRGPAEPVPPRARCFFPLLLAACAILFLALRARWLGHLLMWDEAMNLCSIRAFAAHGHDAYSGWFWRYPPLFNVLLLVFQPLEAGFIGRAECAALLVGLLQLAALALLTRRLYGPAVALGACLAYAILPGAVFYGLWIKQDSLVIALGLLALHLCVRRKWIGAGLALGLAFLSKEMAIFYALAIAIGLAAERRFRALLTVTGVAALTSFWWYAFFSTTVRFHLQFAAAALPDPSMELWQRPWHYYVSSLPGDLGPAVCLPASIGLITLARKRGWEAWPLALTAPALLVLTLARSKVPWFLITLYPALAVAAALGARALWTGLRRRFPRALPGRLVPAVAVAALVVVTLAPTLGQSYEDAMQARERGMWAAASYSREAAETLNRMVGEGERALVTPMHYYGERVNFPCPIFVIYLRDMPLLVRPFTMDVGPFVDDVRRHGIQWAMVSPEPGPGETALIEPLVNDYGLRPIVLRKACIFHTASLWRQDRL